MSGYRPEATSARDVELRARNRRTGLILATVALVFFLGVVLQHAFGH